MNFLDNPHSFTRTPRMSEDRCRAAASIEKPEPTGHSLIIPVCALLAVFLIIFVALEHL